MQNLLTGMQLLPINLGFGLPGRYRRASSQIDGAKPDDTSNRDQTDGV
jgi:hypothetical protein